VLASKNSGKYRIQSNAFEGLWLLTDELIRRLRAYFGSAAGGGGGGGGGEPPFAVTFQDALPLQEYFEAIDEHLRCRHVVADVKDALEKRAHQFRVVEKRLLVRAPGGIGSPLPSPPSHQPVAPA
jgi:Bardet-Biedl syndrome 9 protein